MRGTSQSAKHHKKRFSDMQVQMPTPKGSLRLENWLHARGLSYCGAFKISTSPLRPNLEEKSPEGGITKGKTPQNNLVHMCNFPCRLQKALSALETGYKTRSLSHYGASKTITSPLRPNLEDTRPADMGSLRYQDHHR